MAVNDKTRGGSGAGRRLFFGTNLTIMTLLVALVAVAVNWIGHRHNYRGDLARGFGSSRLSQRTKSKIEQLEDGLRISTVYTSDEPETDRKEYFPRLRDLCDEIRQCDKSIKVAHLHSGKDRAELRDRIQGRFGTAAGKYSETVQSADEVWKELETKLTALRGQIDGMLRGESWLSGFTVLVDRANVLRNDLEDIANARDEIEDLVRGEGLPRYKEANDEIKKVNDQIEKNLKDTQTWMKEMDKLVKALADPNSEFATKTRSELTVMEGLAKNLERAIGKPQDQEVPEDPRPVLQEFAKAANALAGWLGDESNRVSAFVKENPAIQQHPQWRVRVQVAIFDTEMPLHRLLVEAADQLSGNAQGIRRFLTQDRKKFELQDLVPKLRRFVQQVEQQLGVWQTNVLAVLEEGSRIDQQSKDFLAQGSGGELFKEMLDRLEKIGTTISELPELELDEIAEGLEEENIVVLEGKDEVRVVKFDEVWPVADPLASRFGSEEQIPQRRVFDGDSAIGSALLSMQVDKPFATVILVGFETEPAPQMRQFGQRRNTGRIPLSSLSTLKEKLEQANFVVKEWNLGAEGDEAKKPEPDADTTPLYVFVPPASPPPPNPMMRQPPQKEFGPEQLKQVREVLAEKGRGIFLASWDMPPRTMFGPPMPVEYHYNEMLKDDWGIEVEVEYRLIRGVPDRKQPDGYALDFEELMYMQLSSFTDHVIGKPLKARRMLMADVCPVKKLDPVPEGVTIQPVLEVPATVHDLWAESNRGIERIVRVLTTGERRGVFSKRPDTSWEPPFSVILAAENANTESKIVVMGTGICYLEGYLTRRVTRSEHTGKRRVLLTDAPPMENAELVVNTMYWLCGREDLIASGPAEVPRVPPIGAGNRQNLWLITTGWAFAILIAGGMMMMIRRK